MIIGPIQVYTPMLKRVQQPMLPSVKYKLDALTEKNMGPELEDDNRPFSRGVQSKWK